MFGTLGLPELLFIFVLALLIFGPKRLPEIGRTIGKGLAEFRRASNDLKRSIDTEILAADTARPPLPAPPAAAPVAAKTEAEEAMAGTPVVAETEPAGDAGATADHEGPAAEPPPPGE